MNNEQFRSMIEGEAARLRTIQKRAAGILHLAPPGKLGIHKNGKYYYYDVRYQDVGTGKTSWRYLKKSDQELFPEMVRKYCAESLGVLAKKQEKTLMTKPLSYDWGCIDQEYSRLYGLFGSLVPENFRPREVILEEWRKKKYERLNRPVEKQIITEAGDIVRSKNEENAANCLLHMGIPYHYEEKLVLNDRNVYYPDFTVISPVTGKKYYIEIFGMMSDPSYVEGVSRKLEAYAKNGIIIGENLLIFFEFENSPFDIGVFRRTIERKLLW